MKGTRAASGKYQRSITKNPNNPAYRAAMNNRSNQLNPNNPAYHKARVAKAGSVRK